MRFPNAFSGVKKLFTAEILQIIGVVAMGVAAIFLALLGASIDADNAVTGLGSLALMSVFAIGGVVVFIIAAILKLVGLGKAGKDNKNFSYALYCVIVGMIFVVVGSFFQSSNPTIYNMCESCNKIADLIATILTIQGIMSLASNLGDTEMVVKGAFIFKVIMGIYIFAILGSITYAFMFPFLFLRFVGLIFFCASLVLSVVSYILFISYLSIAKKMLG
ncbi:MAG: hypothetical protein IJT79_02720 [Ruminococcus sp.]|nr:hypothetical protein [Ruminococcus sp.]